MPVKFHDLKFNPHPAGMGGVQATVKFPNGYGASIIKFAYSYGGPEGLYELAVLDENGKLCYTTPITSDVIGHLTPEKVTEILAKIEAL